MDGKRQSKHQYVLRSVDVKLGGLPSPAPNQGAGTSGSEFYMTDAPNEPQEVSVPVELLDRLLADAAAYSDGVDPALFHPLTTLAERSSVRDLMEGDR